VVEKRSRRWVGLGFAVLGSASALVVGLRAAGSSGQSYSDEVVASRVAEVAGFTKLATTAHYIVVVNVLPAERMFTAAEIVSDHPLEGELVLSGPAGPVVASGRHVEAHIYDRSTGLPTTSVVPSIELSDLMTGAVIDVAPTLMQDLVIGAVDVHFGNNIVLGGDRDIRLRVDVAGEEVVISGHLD
jgi:hypothetical protein